VLSFIRKSFSSNGHVTAFETDTAGLIGRTELSELLQPDSTGSFYMFRADTAGSVGRTSSSRHSRSTVDVDKVNKYGSLKIRVGKISAG